MNDHETEHQDNNSVEVAARRDAGLRRALATPHTPHKPPLKKTDLANQKSPATKVSPPEQFEVKRG